MQVGDAVSSPLHSRVCTTLLLLVAVTGLLVEPTLSRYITSLILHRLPFTDAGRLVHLQETERHGNPAGIRALTVQLWQERNRSLGGIAAYAAWDYQFDHQQLQGVRVTPGFFDILQPRVQRGRLLTAADYQTPVPQSVVISDCFWRLQMGEDPRVIGRWITLNQRQYQVVGVLPASFWFVTRRADLWLPLAAEHPRRDSGTRYLGAIARLQPNFTYSQAQRELAAISAELARKDARAPRYLRSIMAPLHQMLWPDVVSGLMLMLLGSLPIVVFIAKNIHAQVQAKVAARLVVRYWSFLTGKILLLQIGLLLLWLELQELVVVNLTAHWTIVVLMQCVVAIVFLSLCAALTSWCQTDQRYRCRTCLRRLRMPLESGSLGSVLFDRPGAEYICPAGCGQLYVPRPRPSDEGVERWTPSRGLWEELLLANTKR